MTRINVGVGPSELPDKLLLAEHREITRIPNAVRSGRARLDVPPPPQFKLGPGHVRFFYDKLFFLAARYMRLRDECRRRGFNVTDKRSAFDLLPPGLFNDYTPTIQDRTIILNRIHEKGFKLRSTAQLTGTM